ncbi:peptide chain release factor N(5)-glutamine methyltransferase [Uliginosibacterium sp. H1]|uniref:peptide chain release factor N(5)-glutamine methyltransferase n=1 Tax=Uliginosibacterium sp. H1 TaxID=3114757 RepID=UPI002E170D93|nr:peptide chain release factor N(5)-glutamine methyltransferase [Uliginosibacterium sp. H1]
MSVFPAPATIAEALALAQGRVARTDARILLREAAGVSDVTIAAYAERVLPVEHAARYAAWLARREAGEPVAYILGWREFYGRRFALSPATLIPRPDTEVLVDTALACLQAVAAPRIADLGTGSGAIAVTLALERADAEVWATDFSPAALAVAARNAQTLGARLTTREGSWFAPLAGERFHLVASNPPYIAAADPHLAQGDLRFEPATALAAGADGLDDIRQIVAAAPDHLHTAGWLLMEHGYDQAAAVRSLLAARGFDEVQSWRDLPGIERVSGGRLPGRRPA